MTTNLNQEELEELLQMKEQLAANSGTPGSTGTTSASLPTELKRPKASLPDTARYNLNNLVYFSQFLGNLKAKIAIDWQAIGNEQAQVWYEFGRLEGKASARIHPWKALDRLNRLKQGKRSFDELLAELEQLLLKLVDTNERESYDGFKDQVKRVADRVEDFARSERSQLSWRRNASPKKPWGSLPRTSPDPPDVMEWEPTPARAAEDKETQRAAWVSPKELEKRKERGLCFRCGTSGHLVTGCPYKPARRPAKVASAAPCWNLIKAALDLGRERVTQAAAPERAPRSREKSSLC
ncbi:hypothetical protein ACJ73_06929 [Blastomyces percursus]|uniref:CCHC-type domain-containing protein n=1 Tax=Blastomyces percursus TaxID=1658174 RepID=A0A1J9R287_9EURO|nr:hypothetical protein ACJ73_06929 [Blastomyces percursus]